MPSPQVLSFLDNWCPSLEEAQLLRDAVKQLDELFLLVVLGEFNSGGWGGRGRIMATCGHACSLASVYSCPVANSGCAHGGPSGKP